MKARLNKNPQLISLPYWICQLAQSTINKLQNRLLSDKDKQFMSNFY